MADQGSLYAFFDIHTSLIDDMTIPGRAEGGVLRVSKSYYIEEGGFTFLLKFMC